MNRILIFIKKLFTKKKIQLIETSINNKDYNNKQEFKNNIKFDDGTEEEAFIKKLLNEPKDIPKTQEEIEQIKQKLTKYIDVLMQKLDKCQADLSVIQAINRKEDN